jgi:hypothetical protein
MSEQRLSPGSQFIHSPKFIDPARTRVRGIVRIAGGTLKEFEGHLEEANNPFIRDLKMQYTLDEIALNTEKEGAFLKQKEELDRRLQEDEARDEGLRMLAKAKAEALGLEIFQNEAHKEVKRRIRRASSVFEVTALTATAFLAELTPST